MALLDAGLAPADVDEVVRVAGSTRVPLVRRSVESLFGCPAHSRLDPDQVVAMGAAVQANILEGGRTDMLLLDGMPLSLGHSAEHHDSHAGGRDVHDVCRWTDNRRPPRGAG